MLINKNKSDCNYELCKDKIQRIVLCGLFLSLSLLLNQIKIILPYGGIVAVKINLGEPICEIIAIMFGAIYGGLFSAISDAISSILNPISAFIWPFTVVSFIKGYLIGFIYMFVYRKRSNTKVNFFNLYIVTALPNIISSLLDSFILRLYMLVPKNIFATVMVLRLVEKLFVMLYSTSILIIFINVYEQIILFRKD
jgi:ECF transporter S component (folate family)